MWRICRGERRVLGGVVVTTPSGQRGGGPRVPRGRGINGRGHRPVRARLRLEGLGGAGTAPQRAGVSDRAREARFTGPTAAGRGRAHGPTGRPCLCHSGAKCGRRGGNWELLPSLASGPLWCTSLPTVPGSQFLSLPGALPPGRPGQLSVLQRALLLHHCIFKRRYKEVKRFAG